MANANQAQEPSMEEILASIRRIISDEEPAATAKEEVDMGAGEAMSQDDLDKLFDSDGDAEVEPDLPEPDPDPVEAKAEEVADVDDVFELTEDLAVEDDESDEDDMAAAMAMENLDGDDVAFVDLEPEPVPAAKAERATPLLGADDGLLSPDANRAVHSAFTNLAGTILSNNSRTLEDLVKELLRPMLKDWLDENLPSMVDRMVRQEIERISRGR